MRPTRRGFTLVEILLVVMLIGIFAGWAVTRVNLGGYRIDAATRMVQNVILGAQQTAITRGTDVTLRFDRQNHRVETRFLLDGSQRVTVRPLPEGARFLIPAQSVDGVAVDFATGPGIEPPGVAYLRDVRIAPNGTIPRGDFTVYLGTVSTRPKELRALAVRGATTRVTFWTRNSGAWAVKDY